MKRKIFNKLTSQKKIDLKKTFLGIVEFPKLLKFEIYENEVYWKSTKLIEEHCLLDNRLFYLLNFQEQLENGSYWTDGNSIFNLNKTLKDQFEIKKVKWKDISKYKDCILIFENEEFWLNEKKNKIESDILTNYVLETSLINTSSFINLYRNNFYKSNEETLIMSIFEFVNMNDSEIIQPKFEPFEFYSKQKIPMFLDQLFRENWAYRSLILGTYQKLLTNPNNENLILLGILGIEIKKLKKLKNGK